MFKLNLPVNTSSFFGRNRELSRLEEYFETQKIIVIAGITGIGKTALMIKFQDIIVSKYVERAVIWIACQEEWTIESFFDEVSKWLKDRGVKFFDPVIKSGENIDSKVKQLATVLEENSVVMFIDNFEIIENENTRNFVKFAIKTFNKARLIIATRKRIELSPLERVEIFERRLDGLSYEDSKGFIACLFEKYAISMPDENILKNIYSKIQGHPFSLKLLVSLYISGDITFEDLINESSEFGEELENYILDSLFRSLSIKEKNFLTQFSVFNIPVSQQTVEELIHIDNFNSVKNKLTDLYLLEINNEKKYFIHSILKNYCISKISENDKNLIYDRYALYFSTFDDISHKLQAFYYWYAINQKEKAVDFLITFIDSIFKQGKNQELFMIIENVLEVYGKEYPVLKFFKANILLRWGKLHEAFQILEKLKIKDSKKLEADVEETTGRILTLLSENIKAEKFFKKALKIYENIDNIEGMVSVYIGLGECNRFVNNYDKASEYFNLAKKHINEVGCELKGRIYKGLGDIAFRSRNYDVARSYFDKAIATFESIKENFYIGKIKHNLAFLFFETGQTELCIKTLFELLEYRKEINDTVGMIYNFSFIGEIFLLNMNVEEAEKYLVEGLNHVVETDEKRGQVDLYLNLMRLYNLKNDFDSSKYILNSLIEISKNNEGMDKIDLMIKILNYEIKFLKGEEVDCEKLEDVVAELEKGLEYSWAYYGYVILCQVCNQKDKLSLFSQKIESLKPKITEIEIKYYSNIYKKNKSKSGSDYIYTHSEGSKEISTAEYEKLCDNVKNYDLWVDLSKNDIVEAKRGRLGLLKKRTVANVFLYFLNNIGQELSFRDIFEAIWKREYDPETDAITVRVNISRLRSEIEPDSKNPVYIVNAKESGYYVFNPKIKYALIKKKQ